MPVRPNSSQPLSQSPQTDIPAPENVLFRDDLITPVINFQSETDVILLGAVDERQPDSEYFRLWETAGAAHGDNYQLDLGRDDVGVGAEKAVVVENNTIFDIFECGQPMNSGPMPWVYMAALNALDNWARTDTAAPEVERLAVNDDQSDYQYDNQNNVIGGLRTPYVDAPAARLSGEFNDDEGGFASCRLAGTTKLFDAATMATLYIDRTGYIAAVSESTDAAVALGVILPEDAERIKAAAALQWDALPQP